jgi:acyl-coenzyme A thioesterase PaaI-like protein
VTTPLFERDGERFAATALTAGPWNADHCHGGATSALLAHLVEQVASLVPMQTLRLTVELLRPVTRDPVTARTEVLREGRRVQLVRATLVASDGTEVSSATGMRVRSAELDLPEADDPLPPELAGGPDALPRFTGNEVWRAGFFEAVELRLPEGALGSPGEAAGWVRLTVPVVADEPIVPLSRIAAAGDFGNGISAPLPMERFLFINPDLTLAIDRPPDGDWIGMASRSTAQPTGAGRTVTTLADRHGRIGTALQSLYVSER